ncbi:MAG: heme ABC transporter ATP-binding protein CcmA, partial [Gammaproteobacteria bacterium]|nr:heme ABC transporter ATP-binding protein CcmA [Gammaproteobacteria bacterium]
DEPYTALDVEMVAVLDRRIAAHSEARGICLLTTHQPPHQLVFRTLELGRGH